ncbi:MAG: hypothetical protein QM785_07665 [Pyrinomonadaceae bacterium]
MFISLILIALIAFGGLPLTYLVAKEKPMLWRLSAGTVIGSAVLGIAAFVAASFAGFSVPVLILAVVITLIPLALLERPDIRKNFLHDWAKAKGTLQGANAKKMRHLAYYAGFFLLFWLFFDKTMFIMNGGIHTGGSQNLGDLPYHLGTIFSFTEGNNFPVVNPSWVGAKYTYPFVADLLSACFVKLGADVINSMFVLNVAWAFSLFVILESFVVSLTGNKLAGRIAAPLLFLSGGLGFWGLSADMAVSGKGLYDTLMNLSRDYTINDKYRWGNSLVVLFMTQRSLLLGMPLTLLVLNYLWSVFSCEKAEKPVVVEADETATEERAEVEKAENAAFSFSDIPVSAFLVGLLAGTLPLIHMHSLVVLFIVTVFLFVMRPDRWMQWITFGIGVAVVAIPELAWLMTGTATESKKFFEFFFGWDKRETDFFWFWFTNTGLLFPVLAAGIWIYMTGGKLAIPSGEVGKVESAAPIELKWTLVLFYIPFFFLFVLSNSAKLAPWEWDNIKILIYWFAGSLPLVGFALAWAWEKNTVLRVVAGACFAVLIASGSLDVWRTVSGQIKYGVFDADAIKIADQIKQKTDQKALFVNAPTFNSAVVLSGRQSVMRYSGHLASHGIDYYPREAEIKQIYQGGGVADMLLRNYNVDYVLISPEEKNTLKANEEYFKKFPVIAEAGQYRVYKVK